ncbi:MAG: polyribonucleotide nucleotidyltransferase, partial [Planctomycetes bacterium]|nr:polyribonucleotide nucleotidyltransferase [Planctomycetota bacterium]
MVVVEREIGGRTLRLETGRMAKLSDGACVARYGDTMVLAAVNSSKAPDGIDFFPLTVDYREKTAAAGMIPGGFFKREGRPTTKEILACRIIDRSIRPMFPDGFRRDVQVLSQVIASDRENDGDILAAVASFAALALSSLPHGRTLGMVRIGMVGGELVVNPTWTQLQGDDNRLNLTVAGHEDAIAMVEAGAKEVSEDTILEALELAHDTIREIVEMIEELVAKAGKPKMDFEPPKVDETLQKAIEKQFGKALREAPLTPGTKQVRGAATKAAREEAKAAFPAPANLDDKAKKVHDTTVSDIVTGIVKQAERDSILQKGVRADGRSTDVIRPITIDVGVLPRTHGSVLFTRGETQALGVVTLGGTDDQQIIDGLMPEPRKRFLLHYAFPPFSVGETKRMLAPGRREIGHGALAEHGLEPALPSKEELPYTIRVTSDILESNGSSSMATACGGTLAMMDAGVPIKQPVAGIAMGLVMEGKKYAILSDILGSEDACGDMDFKVVGTGRGITALQMDIKCEGLTREILAEALEQARQGRLHILREMLKSLDRPREQLSPNAPRLVSVQVPPDKIGTVIGPGGKNIRMLQEQYECKISIEDSGLCTITGVVGEKVDACMQYISAMTAEVELGAVYEGRVSAIKEFGAFVEILPGQEGLVHVSELSNDFIRAVTDVVRIGDTIKVKVIAIDDFGKIKLSRKALLEGAAGDGPAAPEG